MSENNFEEIIAKCKKLMWFDTARIIKPSGIMFLIVAFKDNEEHCIASGSTEEELLDSVKEYVRLSKMDWRQYFKELGRPL